MDLPFMALSPTTRRRQRGRGTVVLDNLTPATQMNTAAAAATMPLPPPPPQLQALQPANLLLTDAINNAATGNDLAAAASLALPTPSPDELVIQARGRLRGVPITFSPDVHLAMTPVSVRARQMQRSAQAAASNRNGARAVSRYICIT